MDRLGLVTVKTLLKIIVSLSLLLPCCAELGKGHVAEGHSGSQLRANDGKHYSQSQHQPPHRGLHGTSAETSGGNRLNRTILQRIEQFHDLVDGYSEIHQLDPDLVRAVIYVESGGNPLAVSPRGPAG